MACFGQRMTQRADDQPAYQPGIARKLQPVVVALMALLLGAWGALAALGSARSRQVFSAPLKETPKPPRAPAPSPPSPAAV